MTKPKPDDAISEKIPCECGLTNCDKGLILTKYPEGKIKIRIFDKNEIKTVVIDKKKLMKKLKELK